MRSQAHPITVQPRAWRTGLATSVFAVALLAMPASASAEEYPPCAKPPSSDDVEAAKGMHKAAEQYYAKARYDRAIESWRDAYSFDCTAHRLLINVGNAYEKLGQTDKAIEAFDVYIARMGESADPNIVEKVKNLRNLAGTQPPSPTPTPTPTPTPGPFPQPMPTPEGPDDTDPGPGPWILVGVGAAAAIVGGVLLGVGTKKESDAEAQCGGARVCPEEIADLGNEGLNLQIAGGTTLTIGLLAVAGGVFWYLIEGNVFGLAKSSPVRVDVGLSPNYGGVGLSGEF